MTDESIQQAAKDIVTREDERQLDLLAIFHYVFGGLTALFGCCPVIHLTIGIVLMAGGFPLNERAYHHGQDQHPSGYHADYHADYHDSQSPMMDPNSQQNAQMSGNIQQTQPSQGHAARQGDSQPHATADVGSRRANGRSEQVIIGGIFTLLALSIMVVLWVTAILIILAGRNLKRRKGYTFCLIVAGVECLFMPMGTILGVFSLIVLTRPSVKALFSQPANRH